MPFASDNPVNDYLDGTLPTPDDLGTDAEETTETAPEAEVPAEGDGQVAPEVAPAADINWSDRVNEWGGEQKIIDALQIASALDDDEGVMALITEGLRYKGYTDAQIDSFLNNQGVPAEPAEEEDPDRLMTAAEVEAKIAALRNEQTAQEQAAADARAATAVDATIQSLNLNDAEVRAVLAFSQQYATPDERDPGVLEAAIKAGHAAWVAAVEEAAQRYVTDRKDANESVPTPLTSGGTPGGEQAPPPANMEEARAAARRYLKDSGDI